ncbi:MAG TPA: hypothetical protein DEG17_21280 [Cyanobacteria bacterium UBA11149]|nr:hypothetical protein [Cyanobacteria bacterium UBA11367]HBE55939.1 hypothetical protein [Cyanobacteria bacterium UBA11366]HBK63655.1 hypothetical protein [Cyanobacteria bacterium UBA11166]HBR77154.1 hypothetical protein [Cyanobacteria bacterium UBA11159]HBS68653.1 hypothetical protein [Cyanobacteria bacterium UBA11153]HBW91321.1 hypothetical protein [Cyanobacteria bacterium UBA11149]HCA93631.1 hypothetical protein [Cyanobacteria bacterium UBA9226]
MGEVGHKSKELITFVTSATPDYFHLMANGDNNDRDRSLLKFPGDEGYPRSLETGFLQET